jgi:putative phosphoribosyl transferase
MNASVQGDLVRIAAGSVHMDGMLEMPPDAVGVILFAHGSGSSRLSPRNNYVAHILRNAHLATLLLDLLTAQEEEEYQTRFDIALLARRLQAAAQWLQQREQTRALALGLFGASTGAAAALQLAAIT